MPYAKALELARSRGQAVYRVVITAPPGATVGRGGLRVIHERLIEGRLHLVLAYEDYR